MSATEPLAQKKPPQIGEIAPDFELPDSRGEPRRLSDLTVGGTLALLFYRGHW